MTHDVVLLSASPVDGDRLAGAARAALPGVTADLAPSGLRVSVDGVLIASVIRPRRVELREEVERLLPGTLAPGAGDVWWVDVVVAPDAAPGPVNTLLAALRGALDPG